MDTPLRLTQMTQGTGCACKIGPGVLSSVLKDLPRTLNPALLVGFDQSDDACVYDLGEADLDILADPQTSGGLLIALPEKEAEGLAHRLTESGITGAIVGRVEAAGEKSLRIE